MRVTFRWAAPVIAAAVVLSPLLRSPTDDSYPLSTYPMFASDRGEIHRISTAVELDSSGNTIRLSPELIAGTSEPVLASVTVVRAINSGQADLLCEEIVERLGPDHLVEVRTETVDVIALIADGAEPLAVETHARCGNG